MATKDAREARGLGGTGLRSLLFVAIAIASVQAFDGPAVADPLAPLAAAVGAHRPAIGRLDGRWSHQPLSRRWRSDRDPQVLAAVMRLQRQYDAAPTPERAHALAVSALILRDSDKAIALLEQAIATRPRHSRMLGDLAAAYLQRALDQDRFEDYARALAAAMQGTEADPANLDAWFNQSLALRALRLVQQSHQAQQEFRRLAASQRRGDADIESESTLDALLPVSRSRAEDASGAVPAPVGTDSAERDLLAWVDAMCNGASDSATAAAAQRARATADARAVTTGDRFYLAAVTVSERWVRLPRPQLAARCRAVDDYRAATTAYDTDRIQEAGPAFARVWAALPDHPWGLWARLHLAILDYYGGHLTEGLGTLAALEPQAERQSFLHLRARVLWIRGLIRHTQALYEDSLANYRQATLLMRRVGDVESEAALQALLADSFDLLAEREGAWQHRREALARISASMTPRRRHTILRGMVRACLDLDLPQAALAFQHAVVANAEEWGRAAAISEAYLGRASVYARLPSRLAQADLDAARTWASRVTDKTLAPRLQRELADAQARVQEALDPRAAIDALTVAIANATQADARYQLPLMYARRGLLSMRLDQAAAAERDLSQAITLAEGSRASLRSDLNRRGAFDRTFDAFDAMIELQWRAGRYQDVLRYAERGRRAPVTSTPAASAATSADGARGAADTTAIDPVTMGPQLGPDLRVLYFVQVRDRLLTFLVAPNGLSWSDHPIAPDALRRLVDRHRAAVLSDDLGAIAAASAPLTALLLEPHLSRIHGVPRLAIVPAGSLYGLSFAALVLPGTARYLVEEHALVMAPSAERLRRETAAIEPTRTTTALVVTNPRPATLDGGPLPNLPDAEREAATVQKTYPHVTSLARDRATREAFLALAPRADVIHYAGHAVSHPTTTGLSRLILADEADRSGSLFMSDIARLHFDRTRLVVLAACSTADGRLLRGAGTVSLATAFLDAGVPNVIASLWPIDDPQSALLFREFHEAFARGLAPALALRQAQLRLLSHSDPEYRRPRTWAAFQSIGSTYDEQMRRR